MKYENSIGMFDGFQQLQNSIASMIYHIKHYSSQFSERKIKEIGFILFSPFRFSYTIDQLFLVLFSVPISLIIQQKCGRPVLSSSSLTMTITQVDMEDNSQE